MFVDQWELYRSLTCYLLTVPEDTKKTSVQIYKDWKRTVCYHMDASIVSVLLEYIESAKHENRKFLYEAAKLDHFIEGERISN